MLNTKSYFNSKQDLRKDDHSRHANLQCIEVDAKQQSYRDLKSMKKWNLHKYDNCDSKRRNSLNYCIVSVCLAFVLGLAFGMLLMSDNIEEPTSTKLVNVSHTTRTLNSINDVKNKNLVQHENAYSAVSFTETPKRDEHKEIYPKGMTEDMKDILKDNKESRKHDIKIFLNKTIIPNNYTVLYDNILWGPQVENALPEGYDDAAADIWEEYIKEAEVIKMEPGCGRMQNRLVTFKDGLQACVRYRQNTDQIQGEIFSFYVARLLNLTNVAPSVISVIDLKNKLWQNVGSDIATAQWNTNRAVVLTQFIPDLESASIPEAFKHSERHLNKFDILKSSLKDNDTFVKPVLLDRLKKHPLQKPNIPDDFDHIDMKLNNRILKNFVELAQWSDLIVFDYLTGNLDRIVNNLFNFQWNANIMDGPAHNLARKLNSGLLLFLDNESGLLHGYRLIKKYNVYHSLMLDNLCVFRKSTVDALKSLHEKQSIGNKISQMFKKKNNEIIRDTLPPLPVKNVKILHDRIGRVLNQIKNCEQTFSKR